jgi:hypothetical protein
MTLLTTAVWAVAIVWAVAAAQTYLLAVRRSRMAVRRGALRVRLTLISAALLGPAVAVTAATVSLPRALVAAPLLVGPAVAALWWSLPPLIVLARDLRSDPWGPSDPATRRAAAAPILTVPARTALVCAPAAIVALSGGVVAVLVAYGLAAAATATLVWRAPRRVETAARAGLLRRVVVAASPAMTVTPTATHHETTAHPEAA